MASERNYVKSGTKEKELTQLVSDLKSTIQSLSIIVNRLEQRLNASELTNAPENGYINRQQSFSRDSFRRTSRRDVKRSESTPTRSEKPLRPQSLMETKTPEHQEDDTSFSIAPARPSVVKDMKLIFEESSSRTINRQDFGNPAGSVNTPTEQITVDVRSLKQRFEFERNETPFSKDRFKEELQRRKSGDGNRNEEVPKEYQEKVKKVLKYF